MKSFIKNGILKKMIIALTLVIMSINFVVPNYSYALDMGKVAQTLVYGFAYMLTWLGDMAIAVLQDTMILESDIESGGEYEIKYSPGIIFANQVPALDINFIKPMEKIDVRMSSSAEIKEITNENNPQIISKIQGILETKFYKGNRELLSSRDEYKNFNSLNGFGTIDIESEEREIQERNKAFLEEAIQLEISGWDALDIFIESIDDNATKAEYNKNKDYSEIWIYEDTLYLLLQFREKGWFNIRDYNQYLYKFQLTEEIIAMLNDIESSKDLDQTEYKQSIAKTLQPNISKWYNALRLISLVGLLSVLIYIGIRIILSSSSSQDKAKYKNMLKDWLVAICILFVLHYIMAFMLGMVKQVNVIIKNETTSENQYGYVKDSLMSEIRNRIDDFVSWNDAGGHALMYLTLVILTITFTFQYLKRVIFMAFLTLIAPLIALTYPLDKIKDGKAQAFNYWLREYTFNCLIQPVHLFLYTILLSNAVDLADTGNTLYAIVALAFMVPAEKFIKSMFGLKSESPSGVIGAAAGGAMVMSMLNKIKTKPPKDGHGGKDSKVIRTKTPEDGGQQNLPLSSNPPSKTSSNPPSKTSSNPPSKTSSKTPPSSNSNFQPIKGEKTTGRQISGWNKIGSTAWKMTKGAGRMLGGATLGGLAGTLALAANIADGDLYDNPFKAAGEIGGATGIGYAAGSNLTGKAQNLGSWAWEEGWKTALGVEEYNNRKFDNKFYQSDDYKIIAQDPEVQRMCENAGVSVAGATQTYLNQAITDGAEIRDGLKYGISGDDYAELKKAGLSKAKKMKELINKGYTKEQITNMGIIAKYMPEDPTEQIRMAQNYGFDPGKIDEVYKEIRKYF